MAISARNPTPLQILIRQLVEAGVALASLPVQDRSGVARIQVETPRELDRLRAILDTLGYPVVTSDEEAISVLTVPRPR